MFIKEECVSLKVCNQFCNYVLKLAFCLSIMLFHENSALDDFYHQTTFKSCTFFSDTDTFLKLRQYDILKYKIMCHFPFIVTLHTLKCEMGTFYQDWQCVHICRLHGLLTLLWDIRGPLQKMTAALQILCGEKFAVIGSMVIPFFTSHHCHTCP